MSNLITIDSGGLRRFGAQMRALAADTKKIMNAGLMTVARAAATEAKSSASWSEKIPGTIRAGGAGARVYVRAGGAKAPGAAALEHHGSGGNFRHPVYGNTGVWVSQPAHPYLTPAVNRVTDSGGEAIAAAIAKEIEA